MKTHDRIQCDAISYSNGLVVCCAQILPLEEQKADGPRACYGIKAITSLIEVIGEWWEWRSFTGRVEIIIQLKMSVRPDWAFFFESMYSHVYGVKWSLWGVSLDPFLTFSKISIFGRLAAILGSKLTPKWTFSLNRSAFFSGGGQIFFETRNGFIRCPLTRMRSLVPKFAFLVP